MKNFGFTLAELLVALAIVAIASAIMAPAFTNMMPDKYKTRVLNYYSRVANATNDMLDNETIYYANYDANGNPSCIGLECVGQPLVHPYNSANFTGPSKYINILADMLGLEQNTPNEYSTPDGTMWHIQPYGNGRLNYEITLTFDSGANNHTFSADHQNPNQFIFRVNRDGDVFAGDAMTDAYLRNSTNRDKKVDRETALSYLNDRTKNINYTRN